MRIARQTQKRTQASVNSEHNLMRLGWIKRIATPLTMFIVLRGLDNTVLKALQRHGSNHLIGGINPVSFCNVLFLVQLAAGLTFLAEGRQTLLRQLKALSAGNYMLLAGDALLGRCLGPTAYFFALESLSVISQTLLFALVLPVSALMARWCLNEPLPRGFGLSVVLISSGLYLSQLSVTASGMPSEHRAGVVWAFVGVIAFSGAGVTGRRVAKHHWPAAISIGLGSMVSAVVFAVLTLRFYGPSHFMPLQLWWVLGVLGLYALTLSLGSELALQLAYRNSSVATVSLWGSLTIAVSVTSAALLLNEQIQGTTLMGIMVLMAGVLSAKRSSIQTHSKPEG